MDKHWIVVANKVGARVFEQNAEDHTLRVVERFENDLGKIKTSDTSIGNLTSVVGHSNDSDTDGQKDNILHSFAGQVCTYLDHEAAKNHYGTLTIIAEAQVLGVLRKSLGKPSEAKLKDSLSKDFVHVSDHDMAEQLKKSLN